MNVKIEESWKQHIGEEFDKQYFVDLTNFVKEEYLRTSCYPPGRLIFNAFNLCPFDDVKVVIIGQDPYHEPGQAMGYDNGYGARPDEHSLHPVGGRNPHCRAPFP